MINLENLKDFLQAVDKSFPTPLSQKQDLGKLAEKFIDKATHCYAEEEGRIAALVAGYTENVTNDIAYISVVATLPEKQGRGLASGLVAEFISRARERGLRAVHFYTAQSNLGAIRMYRKLGFVEWIYESEPRPNDLHLIYYVK